MKMKLKTLGITAAAVAFAGTAFMTGTAVAGETTAQPAAQSANTAAKAYPKDCSRGLSPYKVKANVKQRTHPKSSATAVALWTTSEKGKICNDGKSYNGGTYTKCGKKSNNWVYAAAGGRVGWVPETCVKGR
ncbi:hypothetical protein GCM10009801_72580 [Streptomyces albiaxialis]|uniref:SH3 domain-containing protein n=1 Tax=Streptomyces albiaxialis TaxID=329523 RepID=A0ABN2WVW9_9ACTN